MTLTDIKIGERYYFGIYYIVTALAQNIMTNQVKVVYTNNYMPIWVDVHELKEISPYTATLTFSQHTVTEITEAEKRKNQPVASGVLDYFPDAIVAIAEVSKKGNDQHNPGKPLHWDRSKSGDEADACMRHFLQRGTLDTDGLRHSTKAAWRILALLQKEIEKSKT